MPTVVGLTFEDAACVHYFSPGVVPLEAGDRVVVETAHGLALATVSLTPRELPNDQLPPTLAPVMRAATPEDVARDNANRRLVAEAHPVVRACIESLQLPMKVVDITSTWEGGKLTVFFSADGRIDFRELVRELTAALSARIHMYQVGARDHAKMLGGIGSCGLEICCSSWMDVFEPVSMRMAKEQSLFLNPSKFSGNCGKLKCCLRYEYDFYSESHRDSIEIGAQVETPVGTGHVVEVNVLKGTCVVEVPDAGRVEMRLSLETHPPTATCTHAEAGTSHTDPERGA